MSPAKQARPHRYPTPQRYQNAEERLTVDNLKLVEEIRKWKVDVHDISTFFVKELEARSNERARMQADNAQLQRDKEELGRHLEVGGGS
jgi:hypothetical protein